MQQTNFKVHIDAISREQKPTGPETGQISKRITSSQDEINAEQLAKEVTAPNSKTWLPGIMNGNRNAENWISQQVFAVDIDDGLTFIEAIGRLNSYGLSCSFAYSTFSSTKEIEKFRLVFVLADPITSIEDHKMISDHFKYLFPEMDKHCTSPATLFHGGLELLFSQYEYVLSFDLLIAAAETSYIAGAKSERSRQDRAKKVAEKHNPINTTIGLRKNVSFEVDRNFNWDEAIDKIQILSDFFAGKWLHHPQLFGIATNLLYVEGGLKRMELILREDKRYTPNNLAIIPYVRRMKYLPMQLSNFSPYTEDHRYKNILEASHLHNGKVIRINEYETRKLAEVESQVKPLINKILASPEQNISLIKVPTGVGKTQSIIDLENVIVASPTHQLKDEIHNRFQVPCMTSPEIPEFTHASLSDQMNTLYECGAKKAANRFIKAVSNSQVPGMTITTEDQQLASEYLKELQQSYTSTSTVITTHQRALAGYQHSNIVFDEDPLNTVLMPVKQVNMNDIMAAKLLPIDAKDTAIIQGIIDKITRAKPNTV